MTLNSLPREDENSVSVKCLKKTRVDTMKVT